MFLILATLLSLPLVEVPATHGTSDTLVVFVSGDGGWASIDKSIARVMAGNGMPVVGLNSLQYFWTKRTPDAASKDLQSIITTYSTRWNKSRVVVIGYSRGADVLPAMINRMPPEVQSKIRLVSLLGPSPYVEFEFHVADWLRDKKAGYAVQPELARVHGKVLCLWGEDDKDSLCRGLAQANVHVVTMKGAHHFDGGYDKLAHIILDELQ
ncbi:MAG TPA: AcvB/VirJ family lysyl-phosphatidylglycerol hydrolase [Thermoanaerobaculia bacterium]|nr:AcvB/VirJ family lysyl-phosphatidylglycerol hydrolase [Thermoanaerobaculia bacterium]